MRREASVWRWYASVNDSARDHLVEQGWFNRQSTDRPMTRDVEAMAERDIHGNVQGDNNASVYGHEPPPQHMAAEPTSRVHASEAAHTQPEHEREPEPEVG